MTVRALTLLAWALAGSALVACETGPESTSGDDMAAVVQQELPDNEVLVVGAEHAIIREGSALGPANYESNWVQVGSGESRNISFYTGFVPSLVTVRAQMYSCLGYWTQRYTYVPPAHSSWDDMYTGGENVYWIEDNHVIVHHEGVIRGTNIHDGCTYQRFKVYAWN